jgi:hypothetical protein
MPGGPHERTITYTAPWYSPDRETDYRTAWKAFLERGIIPRETGRRDEQPKETT